MHLVDDVHLGAAARRSVAHPPDDLIAHVINAGATGSVQLIDIRMLTICYVQAILRGAIGVFRVALLALESFREKPRRGGLAGTSRPREQVGMAHLVCGDGVLERPFDMLLPYHILEHLRAVLPIQRFCQDDSSGTSISSGNSSIPATGRCHAP